MGAKLASLRATMKHCFAVNRSENWWSEKRRNFRVSKLGRSVFGVDKATKTAAKTEKSQKRKWKKCYTRDAKPRSRSSRGPNVARCLLLRTQALQRHAKADLQLTLKQKRLFAWLLASFALVFCSREQKTNARARFSSSLCFGYYCAKLAKINIETANVESLTSSVYLHKRKFARICAKKLCKEQVFSTFALKFRIAWNMQARKIAASAVLSKFAPSFAAPSIFTICRTKRRILAFFSKNARFRHLIVARLFVCCGKPNDKN